MVRVATDGGAIELEVWSLPAADGRQLLAQDSRAAGSRQRRAGRRLGRAGFLCESHATEGAEDITSLGGWRAYLKTLLV